MKKPTIEKLNHFFTTIGLTKSLMSEKQIELYQQTPDNKTCVNVQEISGSYVDSELLCEVPKALEVLEKTLYSKPERIKEYDGITWRFKIPLYGYVSIEEQENNTPILRLDNGI